MPVSGGEEADGNGNRRTDFGAVKRQMGRQVIGDMPQNAKTQHERKDKQAQLDQSHHNIRHNLGSTSFTVEHREETVQGQQKNGKHKRDSDEYVCQVMPPAPMRTGNDFSQSTDQYGSVEDRHKALSLLVSCQ